MVHRLARYAWLPVPLLLALVLALWLANLRGKYESETLLTTFNFICSTVAALFVAVLVGRSYLSQPTPGLLLFGCGVILWGSAGTLVPVLMPHGTNALIGGHNTLVWLAAACHLAGALLSLRPVRPPRLVGTTLVMAYAGAACTVWLLALCAVQGWLPLFFVQGQGGTPLRTFVLASAAGMFAFTAAVLWRANRPSPSAFVRWYQMAMLLVAVGLLGITMEEVHGGALSWTGRAAQFLAGLYMLVAAVASVRESGVWALSLSAALQESQERYRQLVETASEGIWQIDERSRTVYANPRMAGMLGYTPEEMVGRHVREFLAHDEMEDEERRSENRRRGLAESYERQLRRKDGSTVWTLISTTPMRSADDAAGGSFSMVTDITDRKQSEQALRESEARLRALAEALPQIVWTADADGNVEWYNHRWYDYTGLPVERGIGWGWDQVTHRDDLEQTVTLWREACRQGELFQNDVRVRRRDGQYRWFLVRAWPLRDEAGKVVRWFGSNTDIDDLKTAETALRRSGEDLDRAQKVGQIGSWRLDTRQNVLTWSDENYRIFGVPKGTPLTYEAFLACVHPDDRQYVDTEWQAGLRGKSYDIEHRIVVDGQVKWVRQKAFLELDDEEAVLGGFGITQDITARKHTENELRQAKDQLEQRVRERTAELQARAQQLSRLTSELTMAEQRERQHLAQVLHDGLQQLLVAARFRLNVLEASSDAAVRKEAKELSELIADSIETSRSLTAELSPPVLKSGLVPSLEWLTRWMQDKHGLVVDLDTPVELTPLAENVTVLLFQAARELLFNVVKHAGVKAARLTVVRDTHLVFLVVEDKGCGFDPRRLRAGSDPSSGLGLFAIAERLELLGGCMEIHSKHDQGSRLTLMVPTGPEAAIDTVSMERRRVASVAFASPGALAAEAESQLRIALVDDHAVVRQGLATALRQEKRFQLVGEASDGKSAVELVRHLRPDVVLMDISMPGLDGIAATKLIHDEFPDVCVIGLSMHDDEHAGEQMRQAGAVAYLNKSGPVDSIVQSILACGGGAE
jgi:PAS domain S-box-containing protein